MKRSPYTGYVMPHYAGGIDEAVDTAETTRDYVLLEAAPASRHPHLLCSPRRMVTPVTLNRHGEIVTLADGEYHPKV